MTQVVSISFFRFNTRMARLWALVMMGLARGPLARTPDIGFWKLCGSGGGVGFTPRINIDVIAILAVWPDAQTARKHTASAGIFNRYRTKASEDWTVFLSTASVRGNWTGQTPFLVSNTDANGPMAVLTRATIKPSILRRFWARVPDISAKIAMDPHVMFKIGIGETPLFQQITFSIWPDTASMTNFARTGPHAEAITSVRENDWFQEELYARFNVLSATGTWNGSSPLTGQTTV